MKMKKNLTICSRNESPDTCMLCESEGQDYCMVCADACTLEDLRTTARDVTHDHYVTLSECLLDWIIWNKLSRLTLR